MRNRDRRRWIEVWLLKETSEAISNTFEVSEVFKNMGQEKMKEGFTWCEQDIVQIFRMINTTCKLVASAAAFSPEIQGVRKIIEQLWLRKGHHLPLLACTSIAIAMKIPAMKKSLLLAPYQPYHSWYYISIVDSAVEPISDPENIIYIVFVFCQKKAQEKSKVWTHPLVHRFWFIFTIFYAVQLKTVKIWNNT